MHDTKLVVVQAFAAQSEADVAKSALESAGIHAVIQGYSAGGMLPHLAWSTGGFRLLVSEADLEAAQDALQVAAPYQE